MSKKTEDQIEGPGRVLVDDQLGKLHSRDGTDINGIQRPLEKTGLGRRIPSEPRRVGGNQRLLGPKRELLPPPRGHLQNLIPLTGARQGRQTPGCTAISSRNSTQEQENR